MVRLVIHVLNTCATCKSRSEMHRNLALLLSKYGVDSVDEVMMGRMEDGKTYLPEEGYDNICISGTNYVAPTYALEIGNDIHKLPDMAKYGTVGAYADYIGSIISQA